MHPVNKILKKSNAQKQLKKKLLNIQYRMVKLTIFARSYSIAKLLYRILYSN